MLLGQELKFKNKLCNFKRVPFSVTSQGTTLGYNGLKPYALKGQKLLAQGTTLGYNGLKPVALKGQKLSLNTNF